MPNGLAGKFCSRIYICGIEVMASANKNAKAVRICIPRCKERLATTIGALMEHRTLIASVVALSAGFLCLWQFGKGDWRDFGLNAFTETIGIGITVFLIDYLIKKQEQRRRRPLELAAFADVQDFVDGLAVAWINVYDWSGKDEMLPPPSVSQTGDFLTMHYFDMLRFRLNLDAEACVFPKRTWWKYLPQLENEYRQKGEKILERHAAVLDPYAFGLVHKVLNGFLDPNIGLNNLALLRDLKDGFAEERWSMFPEGSRHRLGRYWHVFEGSLTDFAALHKWYRDHRSEYLGDK